MIPIFDRYLIRIFIRAFLICFASLVGLYIVIDAFSNLDEFSEHRRGLFSMLALMGEYYFYRVSLFFDRLSGVITTLSAMFTFSWIQRTNELMPMLAAGIPVYRIIAPVLIAAMIISGLAAVNQELVIPRIAQKLQMAPDDNGERTVPAHPMYDSRGILLAGSRCDRQALEIRPAFITLPTKLAGSPVELKAAKAKYVSPGEGSLSGGWLLSGVIPTDAQCSESVLEPLGDGNWFLHTTVTFEQISRQIRWFEFSSTRELLTALRSSTCTLRSEMVVLLHARLTKPLATLTLLLLGLPFVLSGADRRMVSLVGISLVVSLSFQLFCHLCQRLGNVESLPPALAAWLPVMIFGSLAIGMFDMVKT